jgi:hypothetical protein
MVAIRKVRDNGGVYGCIRASSFRMVAIFEDKFIWGSNKTLALSTALPWARHDGANWWYATWRFRKPAFSQASDNFRASGKPVLQALMPGRVRSGAGLIAHSIFLNVLIATRAITTNHRPVNPNNCKACKIQGARRTGGSMGLKLLRDCEYLNREASRSPFGAVEYSV